MDGHFNIADEGSVKLPMYIVTDKVINENKARSTLPDILFIGITSDCVKQFGVFAKCDILGHTQFGPLDAPLAPYSVAKSSPFLLKSQVRKITTIEDTDEPDSNLYYDTSQDKRCNWMCLVRPASCPEEQNMVAHFVRHDVYFTTTRFVSSDEELRVWYTPSYAQFMGQTLLSNKEVTEITADDQVDNGSVKYLRFRNSRKPTKKTNDCEDLKEKDSVDVRSVPPKKRGWRRTSQPVDQTPAQPTDEQSPSNGCIKVDVLTSNEEPLTHDKIIVSVQRTRKAPVPFETAFLCPQCGKSFAKKYTLKNHLTTHSDVFDFICHTCGKGFKRKDKLHEHMKRMHLHAKRVKKKKNKIPRVASKPRFVPRVKPNEYEKFLFKCLKCRVGFQRRGMLINHFLKQHPDTDVSSVPEINLPILKEEIAYVCLYCNKSYKSSTKRRIHIEKHHPGQSLPPNYSKHTPCVASGIAKRGLRALNPVLCPYCPSQYTTKSKMYNHVSSKHPSKVAELNSAKKKKKVETPKKPKRERSTRIPLPPLAEMITLLPVPEADLIQERNNDRNSLTLSAKIAELKAQNFSQMAEFSAQSLAQMAKLKAHPSKMAELNSARKKKKVETPKKPKRERSTRIPLPPLTEMLAMLPASEADFIQKRNTDRNSRAPPSNTAELINARKKKAKKSKKTKREKSTRMPLPPMAEMVTLLPVPEADLIQERNNDRNSLALLPTNATRKVSSRGGDRTEDLSNVKNIINMLSDVSSKTFMSDLEETTAATQHICNVLEAESADELKISESAESVVADVSEEESLSDSVVATATSYRANHSIDIMEEVTISQEGDKVLETDEVFDPTKHRQEQFTNSASSPNQDSHDSSDEASHHSLPLRYIRGRKQLLLQAKNDERKAKKNSSANNPIRRSLRKSKRRNGSSSSTIHQSPAAYSDSSAEPRYDVIVPHPRSAQPKTTASDMSWIY